MLISECPYVIQVMKDFAFFVLSSLLPTDSLFNFLILNLKTL